MSKQTAAEWLYDKCMTERHTTYNWSKILEQAKEMEKQQNELTCINVIEMILDKKEQNETIDSKQIFEDYYNETFNK